jgi:hypothetical protein
MSGSRLESREEELFGASNDYLSVMIGGWMEKLTDSL